MLYINTIIPPNGKENQVLTKSSDTHFDVEWKDSQVGTDLVSYSLDEQWTGKYWIDGRRIYRKVINYGSLPNNSIRDVDHNILNLHEVVKLEGRSIEPTTNSYAPINVSWSDTRSSIGAYVYGNYIRLTTGMDRTTWTDTKIILSYTCTDR